MKVEIKSLGAKSMFKTTLYLMSIPVGIMSIFGIVALIIGIAIGDSGMTLAFLPLIIMSFFMILIFGAISMLVSVIYNFFAKKFGGLELTITTKDIEASKEDILE